MPSYKCGLKLLLLVFNCIKVITDLINDSNLRSLRQNDIDLLFGPSSQDLLSEILFVIRPK